MHLCTDWQSLTPHEDVTHVIPDGTCLCLSCASRISDAPVATATLRRQVLAILGVVENA